MHGHQEELVPELSDIVDYDKIFWEAVCRPYRNRDHATATTLLTQSDHTEQGDCAPRELELHRIKIH